MKNLSIIAKLNAVILPAVENHAIRDNKGEAFVPAAEALFSVDWKTLHGTLKSFDFTMAKTHRASFVAAVQGEWFAREVAALNAERAAYADIDFEEAAEGENPAEVAKAKETAAEAVKRIEAARNFIEDRAKESGSITVRAIVSALRRENMPAAIVPLAERLHKAAKDIAEAAAKPAPTEAEVEAARAILAKPAEAEADAAKLTAAADAAEVLRRFELAESKTAEGIPNIYPIRAAATKLIKAFWQAAPAEGVDKANYECNHALAVKLFGMVRKPREVNRKGKVTEVWTNKDDIAREVVFAVIEAAQKRAAAEAAEAEAKREAAAKPAKPAKPAKNSKPAK